MIDFQDNRHKMNTRELAKIIVNELIKRGFDHDKNNDITFVEWLIASNTKIKD